MKTERRFKKIKLAFLAAAVLCLAFALCACGEAENTDIGAGSDASVADVTEEMLNSEEEAGAAVENEQILEVMKQAYDNFIKY